MASGVNARGSCKGAALEIPIQVRVQALSLAVFSFSTGVNRNNQGGLPKNRRSLVSLTLELSQRTHWSGNHNSDHGQFSRDVEASIAPCKGQLLVNCDFVAGGVP